MTGFDYVVIAILAGSLLLGLWRGLTYELLSLAGWVVAFLVSKYFAPSLAPMMPGDQSEIQTAVAYAAVFIASLILWAVLVKLTSKLVKALGLGGLDVVLGGVFGLMRGFLVVLVLAWLAGLTQIPAQPFWRTAQLSRPTEDVALITRSWLPDNVAQRIRYRTRG